MNIIQFWIVDSIVKAGAHSASVALPSDDIEHAVDPDQEPLFRASMDDDEDDELRRHDIENPRPVPRSRSSSREPLPSSSPDESKSSAGTSVTVTGSGSVTPKGVALGSSAIAMHAYPPSLASASTSPASSWNPSTRASSISPQPKRWRRSPPPPLTLQARSPPPRAVNTAKSSAVVTAPLAEHSRHSTDAAHDEKEWAAWDESGDDWANRVGEEDWTGNRMDARQAALHNVWIDQPSARISARQPRPQQPIITPTTHV